MGDCLATQPDGRSVEVTLPRAYLTRARIDPDKSYDERKEIWKISDASGSFGSSRPCR